MSKFKTKNYNTKCHTYMGTSKAIEIGSQEPHTSYHQEDESQVKSDRREL